MKGSPKFPGNMQYSIWSFPKMFVNCAIFICFKSPDLSWPNLETLLQTSEICLPIILNPVKLKVNRIHHTLISRLTCEAFLLPDLPNHAHGRTFDLATKEPAVCSCHDIKGLKFLLLHPLSQISLKRPSFSNTASWNWPPVTSSLACSYLFFLLL